MSDFTGAGTGDEPVRSSGLISSSSAPAASNVSSAWSESTPTDPPPAPTPGARVSDDAGSASPRVELDPVEARVLGALIEKSFLTPDVYPMTTNAMVSACNQKTNREPVVAYTAVEVDAALMQMRQRNLVRRVHSQGSRSTKHRQTLDEALAMNESQLALMSVLLLRGPQTIGELRLRTERHDVGFDDLDAVESTLRGLASRQTPLVLQLERQPGQKEARWMQLLVEGAETDGQEQSPASESGAPTSAAVDSSQQLPKPDIELARRVDELESEVATLRRQLAALASQLGETLE